MKQFTLIAVLVMGMAIMVSAQDRENSSRDRGTQERAPRVTTEKVTVSGQLTIAQGNVAVKNGEITYVAAGLIRYAGFIDGLKDGAQVTLEGTAITNPRNANIKYLMVSKMTLAGKDYDIGGPWMNALDRSASDRPAPNRPGFNNRFGFPMQPNRFNRQR